ncbi:hypothetical protein [Streptomyces fradiae]|uniref:hypothetical protein n=1 Tax=Streptomyces fradiae TaxID=1906 RepID=UPI00381E7623
MQTYTFLCDWTNHMNHVAGAMFAVVVQAETYPEAEQRAARAALEHFPSLQDYESASTFWGGDFGAVRVAEFYDDVSPNLIDKDRYEIIRASEGA